MNYTEVFNQSTVWILDNAWNVGTALVALVAGFALAGFVGRHAADFLPRTGRIDQTLAPLLSQLARYGILMVTLVIVLSQLGINTTSILAVLGAVGLAVALALQGTLANLASGILIIWFRPFQVGEYIDAEGVAGTVVEIGLFGTRLRTYEGIFLFAPNSRMWNAKVVNFTREKTRMIQTKIRISYNADVQTAREALLKLADDPRVLKEPAPEAFIDSFGDSAVVMCLRTWVNGGDWWPMVTSLREGAKRELDNAGVEIPYPKLDLYVKGGLPRDDGDESRAA